MTVMLDNLALQRGSIEAMMHHPYLDRLWATGTLLSSWVVWTWEPMQR